MKRVFKDMNLGESLLYRVLPIILYMVIPTVLLITIVIIETLLKLF